MTLYCFRKEFKSTAWAQFWVTYGIIQGVGNTLWLAVWLLTR